jgi:hypothetical protein
MESKFIFVHFIEKDATYKRVYVTLNTDFVRTLVFYIQTFHCEVHLTIYKEKYVLLSVVYVLLIDL